MWTILGFNASLAARLSLPLDGERRDVLESQLGGKRELGRGPGHVATERQRHLVGHTKSAASHHDPAAVKAPSELSRHSPAPGCLSVLTRRAIIIDIVVVVVAADCVGGRVYVVLCWTTDNNGSAMCDRHICVTKACNTPINGSSVPPPPSHASWLVSKV